MATSHVPKFGNWENDDVPYTAYFENARKENPAGGHVRINPNDPEENPEGAMNRVHLMPLESEAPYSSSHAALPFHHRVTDEPTRQSHRSRHHRNNINSGSKARPRHMTTSESGGNATYDSTNYTDQSSSDNNSRLRRPTSDYDHHEGRQTSSRANIFSDHHKKTTTATTTSSSHSAKGISDRSSSSGSDIKGHGRHTSTGSSNKNNSIENHSSDHQHQQHHRTTSIPKFGAWDVNDPKSGEGFTFIFEKLKEEKTNSTAKVPNIVHTPHHNYFKDQNKLSNKRFSIAKICCCFSSGGK